MKHKNQNNLLPAIILLGTFVLWTMAIQSIDVQPIGPDGSAIGFADMNQLFHELTGVHMYLYTITDWLSLIPPCLQQDLPLRD